MHPIMGAFDSIKMGYRCKAWSLESDVPLARNSMSWTGPDDRDDQWIVNAMTAGRAEDVIRGSKVVLDGGSRWVLSTALGFFTGTPWGTIILLVLAALSNFTAHMHTPSESSALASGGEAAGIVAYTVLATTISMASVPGKWLAAGGFGRKGLTGGLVVELVLCFSVVLSAGIMDSFLKHVLTLEGVPLFILESGRWLTPALLWVAASELRNQATSEIKTKLRGLWCFHPHANRKSSGHDKLWDDWSAHVQECASRVGGLRMLGFTATDLGKLRSSSPSDKAIEVLNELDERLTMKIRIPEPWIEQSLAFLSGYDDRLRHGCPTSDKASIPLKDVKTVVRGVLSTRHAEIDEFRTKIHNDPVHREQYQVTMNGENRQLYYAGALISDSDQREENTMQGEYGPRLAVSLALFAEGTDPLARLDCFADSKVEGSSVQTLSKAISSSAKALVTVLARSANVVVVGNPLGERGVAYAKVSTTSRLLELEYSPDELVAALHLDEAIVMCDDTFTAGTPTQVLKTLWGGSESLVKRVDVSDMVPLMGSPSELGASAYRGWTCHVGFTLALLMVYLLDQGPTAVVVLCLTSIPASNPEVAIHMENHFHMIYISYILSYIRFASRAFSLSPRGQASVDKAKRVQYLVFLFVNVLPVVACTICRGWIWWLCFSPCIVANVTGVLNTFRHGWDSAFEYKWWSCHMLNRRCPGRSYLQIEDLRMRVGRNVLSVNANDTSIPQVMQKVLPQRGLGVRFMVIGSEC